MNIDELLITLKRYGVVTISRSERHRALAEDIQLIADALGTAVPGRNGNLIEFLEPHHQSDAHSSSMSKLYGKSEQPFHVDHSHRANPCRYLVFGCVSKESEPAPTWLLDTQSINCDARARERLHTSVFAVKNGRKSFYSTVIPRSKRFWRWDPGCMYPTSEDAEQLARLLVGPKIKAQAFSVDWNRNDILVLDNWRHLHARGACDRRENNRTLLRASIK